MTLPAMILLSNDGRQLNEIHATMLETHWLMSHRAWLLVLLVRHFDEWGGLSALSLCVLFEWLDTKSRTLPLWRASLILRMFPTSKTRQIRSDLSLNASLNISHTSVLWGNTVVVSFPQNVPRRTLSPWFSLAITLLHIFNCFSSNR